MLQIILMRHAEAIIFTSSDEKRPLSERGKLQAEQAAKKLATYMPDKIFSSPYLRAQQTAKLVLSYCPAARLEIDSALVPQGDVKAIAANLPQKGKIILITHMPLIRQLHGFLLTADQTQGQPFATAEFVGIEFEHFSPGFATPIDLS